MLVEKDEGGAALPAEDNVDPTGTAIGGGGSGGGSPFGKKRRRRAAGAAAEVEPLQAPIRLLAKGEDPFAPTPPPTTAQVTPPPPTTTTTTALDAAPSRPSPATAAVAIEHSPSFPENDGRPSSVSTTAASSPLPPRPASADPDISYHKVLAAREAARQHAARDISSAAADTDDGSADARPFPAAAADEVPRKRVRIARRKVGIDDFELIRVLGKGCAGKVLLVRKKDRDGSAGGPLLALVRPSPAGSSLRRPARVLIPPPGTPEIDRQAPRACPPGAAAHPDRASRPPPHVARRQECVQPFPSCRS